MARNVPGTGRRPHKWRDRWRAYLTTSYHPDGRPKREYVYGDTESACQAKLDVLRRQRADGTVTDAATPLSAWLKHWLASKAREVSPRTIDLYTYELAHLPATLTRKRLDRITPMDVQAAVAHIHDDVSARSARYARSVLGSALKDAVALGVIGRNPAQAVKGPRYEAAPIEVWTAAQVTAFLNTTRDRKCWYYALFYTALTTGARSGELIALQWSDLVDDRLSIERTASQQGKRRRTGPTKTRASTRVIRLPGDTLSVLAEHRQRLKAFRVDGALMFPTMYGGPLNQSNMRRALRAWAKDANVPKIKPHDLRHTYASMVIAGGLPVADLARQLGHTDPGFTLKRYVHFFERATPRDAPSLADLTGTEPPSSSDGRVTPAKGAPVRRTLN